MVEVESKEENKIVDKEESYYDKMVYKNGVYIIE